MARAFYIPGVAERLNSSEFSSLGPMTQVFLFLGRQNKTENNPPVFKPEIETHGLNVHFRTLKIEYSSTKSYGLHTEDPVGALLRTVSLV